MFTDDSQYQALAKQLEKVPASVIREIVEIQYPNDTKIPKDLSEDERWQSCHWKSERYWR